MRLNNKGWGYRMMMVLMSILVLALLVAVFYIHRFYKNIKGSNYTTNSSYIGDR